MWFCWIKFSYIFKKKLRNAKITSLDNLRRKGSSINKKRLSAHNINNYKFNIEEYSKIKNYLTII